MKGIFSEKKLIHFWLVFMENTRWRTPKLRSQRYENTFQEETKKKKITGAKAITCKNWTESYFRYEIS